MPGTTTIGMKESGTTCGFARGTMNLVGWAHRHRSALFVLLTLALFAGVQAIFHSSRSIYPRVAFPRISVIAERGEEPVRGMLAGVTRPIEQSVSAVPGLMRVRSKR